MKKHYHAVRVCENESGLPLERLFVVSLNSDKFSLDDFVTFNQTFNYSFIQSFYAGYMTKDEFEEKYKDLNFAFWDRVNK